MTNKLFSLAIGAAILQTLVTLPARAETYNFASNVNANVFLTVLPYPSPQEISTQTALTGPDAGDQFYVGLTQGIITVGGTVDPSTGRVVGGTAYDPFYMYCVDFNNGISVPTSYVVNIESLMVGSFVGDPVLGESLATLQLQMTLGAGFGVTPSGNASADSDFQEDIWNLSSAGAFAPPINNMAADLINAEAAAVGGDFSNAFLLDTTGEPGQQAFMPVDSTFTTTTSNPVTPEPSTLGLMALALAGLGIGSRRKKRPTDRSSSEN